MSVKDKKRVLNRSITDRKIGRELESNEVPRAFLLFCLWMIPCVLYAGVWIGSNNPQFHTDFNKSLEIDGVEFYFVSEEEDPKMKSVYGYTYKGVDKVWLRKEFLEEGNLDQLKTTCNHEMLHVYGMGNDAHDAIRIYENQISDPTCTELVRQVTY